MTPLPAALPPSPEAEPPAAPPRPDPHRPRPAAARAGGGLAARLVADGSLAPGDLVKALALAAREQAELGDILLAHGMVGEAALARARAAELGTSVVDPGAAPPDFRLVDRLGAAVCLQHRILPWRRRGGVTVVLAARPDDARRRHAALAAALGPVAVAVAAPQAIEAALAAGRGAALARAAERTVDGAESCRTLALRRLRAGALALVLAVALAVALAPVAAGLVLLAWAVLTLIATSALKALAAARALASQRPPVPPGHRRGPGVPMRLPPVSLIVPLRGEARIARRLLVRLSRLSYPRELLEVILAVEEGDRDTRQALAAAPLPRWMRVVAVPPGSPRTKPRALNYALGWCRGSIVGVYDAEDQPDPDQLHAVVRRFHEAGPEVACLQGVLDFYNPRTNWLARCFTIEYAVWFRLVLPGLARLGLPVPLGGTTVFFRRAALEAVGCWDAHNVTEDADLGLRLARRGYRTELIPSVTEEEANCRVLPWVRQRSRWIKGYALTWAVHMRRPRRLWTDLGATGFLGVQALFLGSLSQNLLAPFLWSFWLLALGLPHPVADALPPAAVSALVAVFLAAECLNLACALVALPPRHRGLRPWAATLPLYFPLAALAAWKAVWEIALRPFYWDKTAHGLFDPVPAPPEAEPDPPPQPKRAGERAAATAASSAGGRPATRSARKALAAAAVWKP